MCWTKDSLDHQLRSKKPMQLFQRKIFVVVVAATAIFTAKLMIQYDSIRYEQRNHFPMFQTSNSVCTSSRRSMISYPCLHMHVKKTDTTDLLFYPFACVWFKMWDGLVWIKLFFILFGLRIRELIGWFLRSWGLVGIGGELRGNNSHQNNCGIIFLQSLLLEN